MCSRAQAQPQPIAAPPVVRYPIVGTPPPGVNETVADMGLWQEFEAGSNQTPDSGTVTPRKVFVLGTTAISGSTQLTLARYDLSGTLEYVVKWPGTGTGISLRAAKAMTIPIAERNVVMTTKTPRIFVLAAIDGAAATTDIAVLAFNFDLSLRWMQTFNYLPIVSTSDWAGNDDPVAITTDQPADINYEGLDYSIIAVLGSSTVDLAGTRDWVTLAYNRIDGCQIMPAQRYHPANLQNGTPVDIACGRGAAADPLHPTELHTAIFVTGSYRGQSIPDQRFHTNAYLLFGDTCLTSTGNGTVAAGWPRVYRGATFAHPDASSTPVRCRYNKGYLYVAGTATPVATISDPHVPLSDIATIAYYTSDVFAGTIDPEQRVPLYEDRFDVGGREDRAVDMDMLHTRAGFGNTAAVVAVTGTSTGDPDTGTPRGTAIATMLYSFNGIPPHIGRFWSNGALWVRDPFVNEVKDDEGVRVQVIDSGDSEAEPGSLLNVYVTGKGGLQPTGYQYETIKYGSANTIGSSGYKEPSWIPATIPNTYYTNSGTSGDHVPVRIWVERSLLPDHKFFVTGNSWGGASAIDWATMFSDEHP